MKKIVTSVIVVLSTLTACTVQNQGQSYDEVYYSPNDKSTIAEVRGPVLHKVTKEVEITADSNDLSGNGTTQDSNSLKSSESYVTDNSINNNFNYDDYYDYSYASRIRRFQYGYFNDYYHDFYTNRYWYDYNPGFWGSSIYSGWGMTPGISFYMDPFYFGYSPFYGFGYNGFWNGYNRGFYDGYYGYGYGGNGYGYGGYGYGGYGGYYGGGYNNSIDHNSSVYYGPRREISSSNGPTPGERTAFSQRYNAFSNGGGAGVASSPRNGQTVVNNNPSGVSNNKASTVNTGNTGRIIQSGNGGNNNLFESSNTNEQRSVNNRGQLNRSNLNRFISDPVRDPQTNSNKTDTRTFQQQQDRYFKDRAVGNPPTKVTRENAAVRYTKPQQDVAPQQYYNPANSRPRSSNEYTSPSYRNPAQYNSRQVAPQKSVSDPQRYSPPRVYQSPVYTAPSNSSSKREVSNFNTRSSSDYSTPSSSSRSTYSAPTQSYSAPSQPSYSAPASSSSSSGGGTYNGPRR